MTSINTGVTDPNFDFIFRTFYSGINCQPVANAGPDIIAYINDLTWFNANNSYDPDGEIINYSWDMGDNTCMYGISFQYVYYNPGIYQVFLTVIDQFGSTANDSLIVTIIDSPNDNPVPNIQIEGYYGDYYNLPSNHPDVEGPVTGIITGDSPFNHDWYDNSYYSYSRVDNSLDFGDNFWPLDEGLPGDPFYFAVHWNAGFEVTGGDYTFQIGSDDDSWIFIDGNLVADLGGIHALIIEERTIPLTTGTHTIDIFFAERHQVQSGFYFKWLSPIVTYIPLNINSFNFEVNQTIKLSGIKSFDPDGYILNYSWIVSNGDIFYGQYCNFSVSIPGDILIILKITDNNGMVNSTTIQVHIIYFMISTFDTNELSDQSYIEETTFFYTDENSTVESPEELPNDNSSEILKEQSSNNSLQLYTPSIFIVFSFMVVLCFGGLTIRRK